MIMKIFQSILLLFMLMLVGCSNNVESWGSGPYHILLKDPSTAKSQKIKDQIQFSLEYRFDDEGAPPAFGSLLEILDVKENKWRSFVLKDVGAKPKRKGTTTSIFVGIATGVTFKGPINTRTYLVEKGGEKRLSNVLELTVDTI